MRAMTGGPPAAGGIIETVHCMVLQWVFRWGSPDTPPLHVQGFQEAAVWCATPAHHKEHSGMCWRLLVAAACLRPVDTATADLACHAVRAVLRACSATASKAVTLPFSSTTNSSRQAIALHRAGYARATQRGS